jgi:hypothetical protein
LAEEAQKPADDHKPSLAPAAGASCYDDRIRNAGSHKLASILAATVVLTFRGAA